MVNKETYNEVVKAWAKCPKGTCKTHEDKARIIELYNEIYKAGFRTSTNCSSCLNTVYKGIKQIIENGYT
jgi:hypothetical protein